MVINILKRSMVTFYSILIIFIFSSCTLKQDYPTQEIVEDSSNNDVSVNVIFEHHEEISEITSRNISVNYPQVLGLSNTDFQNELNKKLNPFNSESVVHIGGDNVTVEKWSEYTLIDDKILCFKEYTYHKISETHGGYSGMNVLTVNTETEEYLNLDDIVILDERFRDIFLNGHFTSNKFSYHEILELGSLEDLYERIYGFYLTEKSLGVIIGTYGISGSYLTLEIPYADIGYLLRTEYKFFIDS